MSAGKEKENALVILGSPRSGGSLLAGCLQQLGVNFGSGAGYRTDVDDGRAFENPEVTTIHDLLFRDLGSRWNFAGRLPEGWWDTDAALQARRRLHGLLDRDFKNARMWAVKDFRISRLMPLWTDVLAGMKVLPKFIIMVRHPGEVAASLRQIEDMDRLGGELLWLSYNREAVAACRSFKHVIVAYDQLLENPVGTLDSIGKGLNLKWPRSLRRHQQKILSIARSGLKHHQADDGAAEQASSDHFAHLYNLLLIRSSDEQGASLLSAMNMHESLSAPVGDVVTEQAVVSYRARELQAAPDASGQNPVSAVIDNLLEIIGRYEQAELQRDVEWERRLVASERSGGMLVAKIGFGPGAETGSADAEDAFQQVPLVPGEWQQIQLNVSASRLERGSGLTMVPLNTNGMVYLSAVSLVHSATGERLWSAGPENQFAGCEISGDLLVVENSDAMALAVTGERPCIRFPEMPSADAPMRLEIWLKAERNLSDLKARWNGPRSERGAAEALEEKLSEREAFLSKLKSELSACLQKYSEENENG